MTAVHEAALDCDEQAALWCLELAEGELSAAQRADLDAWLREAGNHEAFQRAAQVWDVTEAIAGMPEVLLMRAGALDAFRETTARRWRRPRMERWRVAGLVGSIGAAAAAAAAALAFWLAIPGTEAFRTGIGETQVAMLDDGSRLSLDADSSVDTTFDAQHRALVLKKGRARFDVAHNPLRPFTVAVGDKLVVATGTSFSVEKLGGDVHVVLYQGRVAVLNKAGAEARTAAYKAAMEELLTPGNELTLPAIGDGTARISKVDAASSWGRGQVSFDNVSLELAVERMNRYLAEPLVVADRGAGEVRVTGVFDTSDATGFIDALHQLGGVRAQRQDGKIQLTKP